jgi:hypothetical protein
LLFDQTLFDKLSLDLCQVGLQQISVALNIVVMRAHASQMLINHLRVIPLKFSSFNGERAKAPRAPAPVRAEYSRSAAPAFPGRALKSRQQLLCNAYANLR